MQNLKEVIILAGGRGTRLQHLLPDIPKCMAPIRNIPFIDYLITYLIQQHTSHFIFSLGYLHDVIVRHIKNQYPNLSTQFIIEKEALGTGGAILNSMNYLRGNKIFVINGDTYFPVSLDEMSELYEKADADLVIASAKIEKPYRFGTLSFDANYKINSFHEKREIASGYINGGCYLLSRDCMIPFKNKKTFSFETEILERKVSDWDMFASVQKVDFIDIGIPEDFHKAQSFLPPISSDL